jgi:transcriptional regulator with XRE-family HTH domain
MAKSKVSNNSKVSDNRKFSDRLKELRKALGKTQKDFAEEMGLNQSNISQMEKDTCMPSGNFISALAAKYPDVNFNWLVYNEGAPFRSKEVASIELDTQKKLEKKFAKEFEELQKEIARIKQDNSNLITLALKKSANTK